MSSIVAFGFAYFRFPGRGLLFRPCAATMMLPGAGDDDPIIPDLEGDGPDRHVGAAVGHELFGSAFYIFLQRQFFLGVRASCSRRRGSTAAAPGDCFWRIAMPLSIPSFIIVFLFEFQASWNNLQAALIYLNAGSVEDFTAPLGIAYAMTKYSPSAGGQGDYQYVMVASLLVTLRCSSSSPSASGYFVEGAHPRP